MSAGGYWRVSWPRSFSSWPTPLSWITIWSPWSECVFCASGLGACACPYWKHGRRFNTVNSTPSLPPVAHTLLTNGKFQGSTRSMAKWNRSTWFCVDPLLHTDQRNQALVIGYGTGTTSRVLHDAGFKRLDIAELSKDIVHIGGFNFSNPWIDTSRVRLVWIYISPMEEIFYY